MDIDCKLQQFGHFMPAKNYPKIITVLVPWWNLLNSTGALCVSRHESTKIILFLGFSQAIKNQDIHRTLNNLSNRLGLQKIAQDIVLMR